MNVKLKDGRILPIEENSLIALNDNGETLEVNVDEIESFECDGIDWETRRYEIAKAAIQGILSNSSIDDTIENYVNVSVKLADALIAELKKKQ